MDYTSPHFWILFLVVYAFYWRATHRTQNALLLVASYIFYGFWDYRFLFLILLSTIIDFIGGLGVAGVRLPAARRIRLAGMLVVSSVLLCSGIDYPGLFTSLRAGDWPDVAALLPATWSHWWAPIATVIAVVLYGAALPTLYALPEQRRRAAFLWVSMVANLAILGYFKYCGFFVNSFVDLGHALGFDKLSYVTLNIVLPAGISFYTFQAMSYTIDIYRRECEPTDSFADFALFVCFFPHLVAGPIMRAHTLLPQVVHRRAFRWSQINDGTYLVIVGLFKKVVLADNLAPIANRVFWAFDGGYASGLTAADALVGVYAFALQIYGDFSGYSAIARGVSKWLGFELVINFDQPYLATSPSDFWRRWHISLSTWLRDYLYIPLGGNKFGARAMYRNLILTMLLGGLWHGASWTFVAWGLYHGVLLCIFRLFRFEDPKPNAPTTQRLHWILCVLVMFHLTCFGWLLFRAETFAAVVEMCRRLAHGLASTNFSLSSAALFGFYFAPLFALEWYTNGERSIEKVTRSAWWRQVPVYAYLLLMLLVFPAEESVGFIYFAF